jgi:hypothetical protein
MTTSRARPTVNALAVAGLGAVLVLSPLAIILGGVALSQIGRRGQRGRALAVWAVVLGLVKLVCSLLRLAVFGFVGRDVILGGFAFAPWIW